MGFYPVVEVDMNDIMMFCVNDAHLTLMINLACEYLESLILLDRKSASNLNEHR